MKQNNVCSDVKQTNNSSESVNGNKQCSLNVKEAPPPKQTKCNSIAKVRNGIWDMDYFCQM